MNLARTRHSLNIHVFILRTYKLIFSENRKQVSLSDFKTDTASSPGPTSTKKYSLGEGCPECTAPLGTGAVHSSINEAPDLSYNPKGKCYQNGSKGPRSMTLTVPEPLDHSG